MRAYKCVNSQKCKEYYQSKQQNMSSFNVCKNKRQRSSNLSKRISGFYKTPFLLQRILCGPWFITILNMIQLRIGRDGRQIAPAKSATNIKESISTALNEGPICSIKALPSVPHFPKQIEERVDATFSIRVNPVNANSYTLDNEPDIRQIFIRKVSDILIELRRNMSAYQYLEKDQTKAKQHAIDWLQQVQNLLLASLHGDLNMKEAQEIVAEQLEKSTPRYKEPQHINKQHNLLPDYYQQEVQALRVEVQAFRRNSNEEVKKLQQISNLFTKLKSKYNAQKKTNTDLNEAIQFYIDQADTLLTKISAKYQREKTLTILERQVQQVLTKLKFKTFNYHYRS